MSCNHKILRSHYHTKCDADSKDIIKKEKEVIPGKSVAKKRKQVKKACVNCRKSHSACDVERPCRRCIETNQADNCFDIPRKNKAKKQKITDLSEMFTEKTFSESKIKTDTLDWCRGLTTESFSVSWNDETIETAYHATITQVAYETTQPIEEENAFYTELQDIAYNTYDYPQFFPYDTQPDIYTLFSGGLTSLLCD